MMMVITVITNIHINQVRHMSNIRCQIREPIDLNGRMKQQLSPWSYRKWSISRDGSCDVIRGIYELKRFISDK